jgi:hypothetical protein
MVTLTIIGVVDIEEKEFIPIYVADLNRKSDLNQGFQKSLTMAADLVAQCEKQCGTQNPMRTLYIPMVNIPENVENPKVLMILDDGHFPTEPAYLGTGLTSYMYPDEEYLFNNLRSILSTLGTPDFRAPILQATTLEELQKIVRSHSSWIRMNELTITPTLRERPDDTLARQYVTKNLNK